MKEWGKIVAGVDAALAGAAGVRADRMPMRLFKTERRQSLCACEATQAQPARRPGRLFHFLRQVRGSERVSPCGRRYQLQYYRRPVASLVEISQRGFTG